jgi:hypothetical protein
MTQKHPPGPRHNQTLRHHHLASPVHYEVFFANDYGSAGTERWPSTAAVPIKVPDTAAQVDPDAARLQAGIRRQRHAGQSRIVTALQVHGALDPGPDSSEAAAMVYARTRSSG